MATSDVQKSANLRYQRKNMHFSTIKMQNWEFELFSAACAAAGVTPYGIMLAAARAMIAAHKIGVPSDGVQAGAGGSPDTSGAVSEGVRICAQVPAWGEGVQRVGGPRPDGWRPESEGAPDTDGGPTSAGA